MGMVVSPYRHASATVTDPSFSSVVFLAGWDRAGTTNAANYTEESTSAKTVTIGAGAPGTTTNESKFGTASLFVQNGATAITASCADSADWAFGSGAFTLETWVRFSSVGVAGFHDFITQYDTSANQRSWEFGWNQATAQIEMFLSSAGTSGTAVAVGSWSPVINTWYHVVGEFTGTIYRTYVDGVMKGKTTSAITLFNSTARMCMGTYLQNGNPGGSVGVFWLDETRITKGVARYASDSGYTTPTAAFPRS